MWNKLTYRQKLKWLGVGSILLLAICYRFSIAKTIAEYKSYKVNASLAIQSDAQPASEKMLREKALRVNSLMEKYGLDTVGNARNPLSIAGNFCKDNKLQLKEYVPLAISQSDSLKMLTRYITVEGGFIDCLKLAHALETQYQAGKVRAVQFKTQTNITRNETRLYCTIYIQNLISSLYEK